MEIGFLRSGKNGGGEGKGAVEGRRRDRRVVKEAAEINREAKQCLNTM